MTNATTNKAFMGGNGKRREPIVVDPALAEALFAEYAEGVKNGKGNSAIIAKILDPKASPEDKLQVASLLRMMAIESNSRKDPPEKTRKDIGTFLARVSQTSAAHKAAQEALANAEELKSSALLAELKPGLATKDSLPQMARQQASIVGIGGNSQATNSDTPFLGGSPFAIDRNVALEIARLAEANKGHVFTTPLGQLDRNALMDSILFLERESRLAEAEYREALFGRELSAVQRKAIEKASPTNGGGLQNFGQWLAFNSFGVVKGLMPGVFGIDHEKDKRYQEGYLGLRNELISSHRAYLGSEGLRRYLAGLKNQRNEFAKSATSAFDIAELDKLIAATEEKVVAANKADMEKFAETLNKLNDGTLANIKGLTDDEAAMWKFRMLQMVLMASPFGLLNIVGPFAEILAPMLDGSLEFGEGLAQAIENIPFFGDIASAFRLTDFFELFFDQAPIISDVTGLMNEITDCTAAQELGGAAGPGMLGSPLPILGVAAVFSIFRGANELEHMQKSHRVEKDAKKGLTDSFRQLRKGLSAASAETTMKDFHTKQLDIILKSFPKTELVKFIAQAYQEGGEALEIFDKLKIKYKDPTSGVEEDLTFNELKARGVNFGHAGKVTNLLVKGADEEKVGKFLNTFFAYRGVEGDNTADKLKEFKILDEKEIETQGKASREVFEKEKSIAYMESKLGFGFSGSSLDEKVADGKKQMIGHEMTKWNRTKDIVPPHPSPSDPIGHNVRDLIGRFGGKGIAAAA